MLIGELCAGYGGLGMGIQAAIGGEVAWAADNDPGASAILAHRFPGLPNYGDITFADWATVSPVDVLAAGFPCQDVSCAGTRAGLRAGTRTGVWAQVARAISELRPSWVVLENVRGLLSAAADSNVEPCPWCLGEDGNEHPLRAAGAVFGDLASLGFAAEWATVPASAAGAPHRRERVFILAWPAADAAGPGAQRLVRPGGQDESGQREAEIAAGREPVLSGGPAPHPGGIGRDGRQGVVGSGRDTPVRVEAGSDDRDRRGQAAPDTADGRSAARVTEPAPHSRRHDAHRRGDQAGDTADPELAGLERATGSGLPGTRRPPGEPPGSGIPWGTYAPAIARWETITGRAAPAPTEPGRDGNPRLSAPFVEWMMGLPAGWVTGVPNLRRDAQLRALGNGVVPQQAALAITMLLERITT